MAELLALAELLVEFMAEMLVEFMAELLAEFMAELSVDRDTVTVPGTVNSAMAYGNVSVTFMSYISASFSVNDSQPKGNSLGLRYLSAMLLEITALSS